MFFVPFNNIFLRSSEAISKALFDESESILFKPLFINFNFEFGVLAQKCLKPCVNGVLKFKFFFLILSSKVLAGVRVRTFKYPYMDICAPLMASNQVDKFWKSLLEEGQDYVYKYKGHVPVGILGMIDDVVVELRPNN